MARVLLVSQHSLFGSGLQSLLTHQANIVIAGQETVPARAIECVKALKPDVVIVDSECQGCDPAELALAVFRAGSKARVIGLSLKDNTIHIYRNEQRIAHGVEDLMQAIESNPSVSDVASPAEMSALATARSRVYGFLGAVFNRMPDDQFAASLSSPELASFLSSLGAEEDVPPDVWEGSRLIKDFIEACKGKPVEELKTSLAVDRTKLVRGIKPGYGPPPPYEGVYAETPAETLGLAMIAIRNLYAESGVVLPTDLHDQPDFIGFELDFMRHLTEQEAQCWQGDLKEVVKVAEKEQAFLEQHLLTWVPRYCDLMFQEAGLDFYRGIARLTKGFVQGEAQTAAELVNQVRTLQAA